jgi:hypothetical protein
LTERKNGADRDYPTVWQRMLAKEQEEKQRAAADAENQRMLNDYDRMQQGAAADRLRNAEPKLGYDIGALPDFGDVTQPPPQLPYDLDLYEPLGGSDGYRDGDIVVTGRKPVASPTANGHPARTVLAQCDGRIMPGMTGWQNPKIHHGKDSGMGWRTWIMCSDGSGRIGYGHMDPHTTLRDNMAIKKGQAVGRYADPKNGNSSEPHVHVQQYDARGRLIRPTVGSPLTRPAHQGSRYGQIDRWHPKPHIGDDWSEN